MNFEELKLEIIILKNEGLYTMTDREYEERSIELMEDSITAYHNQLVSEEQYFRLMHLLGYDRIEAQGYIESL